MHVSDSVAPSLAAPSRTPSATFPRVSISYSFGATPLSLSYLGAVGLVTRFGKFYKSVDPGLVQVNPCTENVRIVDVKIQIVSIGRQKVITRDNVDVEMYALFPPPAAHTLTHLLPFP